MSDRHCVARRDSEWSGQKMMVVAHYWSNRKRHKCNKYWLWLNNKCPAKRHGWLGTGSPQKHYVSEIDLKKVTNRHFRLSNWKSGIFALLRPVTVFRGNVATAARVKRNAPNDDESNYKTSLKRAISFFPTRYYDYHAIVTWRARSVTFDLSLCDRTRFVDHVLHQTSSHFTQFRFRLWSTLKQFVRQLKYIKSGCN